MIWTFKNQPFWQQNDKISSGSTAVLTDTSGIGSFGIAISTNKKCCDPPVYTHTTRSTAPILAVVGSWWTTWEVTLLLLLWLRRLFTQSLDVDFCRSACCSCAGGCGWFWNCFSEAHSDDEAMWWKWWWWRRSLYVRMFVSLMSVAWISFVRFYKVHKSFLFVFFLFAWVSPLQNKYYIVE